MTSQLVAFALKQRSERHERNFFIRKDAMKIISIKLSEQSGRRPRLAGSVRLRGVGGVSERARSGNLDLPAMEFNSRFLQQFKVDWDVNGQAVLLRSVRRASIIEGNGRQSLQRWCPVVAVEDLETVFNEHKIAQGFTSHKLL